MVYYIEFEKVDAEKIINVFLTDLKVYVTNNIDNENISFKKSVSCVSF
jgi:hypothetical protein